MAAAKGGLATQMDTDQGRSGFRPTGLAMSSPGAPQTHLTGLVSLWNNPYASSPLTREAGNYKGLLSPGHVPRFSLFRRSSAPRKPLGAAE